MMGRENLNDIATSIVLSGGNVYLAGSTESSANDFDYLLVKFNNNLGFMAHNFYNYNGNGDYGIGVETNTVSNKISVIGASQSSTVSCEYAVAVFNASNLNYDSEVRSSIPGTAVDQLSAYCKDVSGNLYLTGKAYAIGTGFNIKTIKITPTYSIAWTSTLDAHGLDDVGGSIAVDSNGDVLVGGFATKINNIKELTCMKLSASTGTLIWNHYQTSKNESGDASATKICINSDNEVYFIGYEKGLSGNKQVILAKINSNGTRSWQKNIQSTTYDILPSDILIENDDIFVISVLDSLTDSYLTTKYSEFETDTSVVYDTNGKALWKQNEIIVRFHTSAINTAAIDNTIGTKIMEYGDLSSFLTSTAMASVSEALLSYCEDCDIKAIKIFPELPTTFTATTSRLNHTVPVPEFWATLLLVLPSNLSVQQAYSSFASIPSVVLYSHPNVIAQLDGVNDPNYSNQHSLHNTGITYQNANINIEEAWSVVQNGGLPFVKVGIFDTGMHWTHPEFGYDGVNPSTSKVDGWDFSLNVPIKSITATSGDFNNSTSGHGTAVGGIVGAIRNNGVGIAGIAGGNDSISNKGVSLYSMRIISPQFFSSSLSYLANAIVASLFDGPQTQYSFGLHAMNHSWGLDTNPLAATWFNPTNIGLLTDAVHWASRMEVTFIAARGNVGDTSIHYPAIIDDDWVLNVGGTGNNGCHANHTTSNANFSASYGKDVDVSAPASVSLSISTSKTNNGYTSFDGTSCSAPHVTGVVALMMSYLNNPNANNDYNNLAPEDCENIIELTATEDPCYPGPYNQHTGHGKLNAGKAMRFIQKMPNNPVKHFGTNSLSSYVKSKSMYSQSDTITLTEDVKNSLGAWFYKGTSYIVDTYEIDAVVSHNLQNSDTMRAIWPRPSSSNVMELWAQGKLRPRERVYISQCNNSTATILGFVYKVKDISGNFIGWLPFDTTLSTAKLEYTILLKNAWPNNLGLKNDDIKTLKLNLFPNPSSDSQTLIVESEKQSDITVNLFDMLGRFIKTVYSGRTHNGINSIHVNIAELPSSLYIYEIKEGDVARRIKFIKN